MRLTIPFTYTADVIVGRASRVRSEMFVEEFEVDVPDFSERDAPIAMTVSTQYNTAQRAPRDVYRFRDGRFYMFDTPRSAVSFGQNELLQFHGNPRADELAKVFDNGHYQASLRAIGEWFRNPGYLRQRTPKPEQVVEWRSSGRDKALSAAQAFTDRLAIVEGKLWFAVQEPRFASTTAVMPYISVSGEEMKREVHECGDPVTSRMFNINDMECARSYCAENGVHHVTFDWNSVNVVMPEVFTFDPGVHALDWTAAVTVGSLADEIGTKSAQVIADWMALRAMLQPEIAVVPSEFEIASAVEDLLPQLSDEALAAHLQAGLAQWKLAGRQPQARSAPAIRF